MTRNWKLLGYSAILAAAFTGAPAPAEPKDNKQTEPDQAQAILRQLAEIKDQLKEVAKKKDLEDLRSETRNTTLQTQKLQMELDTLSREVAQLQKNLEDLARRTAGSPPAVTALRPGGAAIRLVNQYPRAATVLVNNQAYRLAPGETRVLDSQPPGAFTYEVVGSGNGVQTRTVEAGETFIITVHLPGQGPTPPRTVVARKVEFGTVRLVNTFPRQVTVLVNDEVYRLEPGESRTVDAPVGPFTYEVIGSGLGVQNSLLEPGRTVTLRVHLP